jgi:cell wall-associated NlpC family hydrolase
LLSEKEGRALLIAEARKWMLTPYHPNAGVRGLGVDCGQLIVRCFVDCGLVPPFETGPYPSDWHLHRSEERYLGFVRAHLTEFAGPLQPGDVIVFHYGRCYAHGGIVTVAKPLTIIHAFMRTQMVVEEQLRPNGELLTVKPGGKPPLYFTLWPGG